MALRGDFRGGQSSVKLRRGWIVELEESAGGVGLGEALPLPGFAGEDFLRCLHALENLAGVVLGAGSRELTSLLDMLDCAASDAPIAQAAFDMALHDLESQRRGCPLAGLFSSLPSQTVPISAWVPEVEPAAAASSARHWVQNGFETLKLKVGGSSLEEDIARVGAVRERIGLAPRIRLDANGAWSEEFAAQSIGALAPFDIELVEQPVSSDAIEALGRLRAVSPIALAADESCVPRSRALTVVARKLCDIVVLKPPVLGGLRAAWNLSEAARAQGIPSLVTGFLDSPIGVTAALHLASALPAAYASGLAAEAWLGDLSGALSELKKGHRVSPSHPGLGLRLSDLEKFVCWEGAAQSWKY